MAFTGNNVITPQAIGRGLVQFKGTTDATGTFKALYGAGQTNSGTNGSKIIGLVGVNAGATIHLVTLAITNSGGTVLAQLNAVSLPASAGNNGAITPVALMSAAVWPGLPVDGNGNPYIQLNNGDTLEAEYATAQATTETTSLYCIGADW